MSHYDVIPFWRGIPIIEGANFRRKRYVCPIVMLE